MAARSKTFWAVISLVVGSGLGVTITGAFGILDQQLRRSSIEWRDQCQLAVAILTDETLNPTIETEMLKRLTADAAERLDRCIKER